MQTCLHKGSYCPVVAGATPYALKCRQQVPCRLLLPVLTHLVAAMAADQKSMEMHACLQMHACCVAGDLSSVW
jgi:hypothetical protein